jgi:hypothetical protein
MTLSLPTHTPGSTKVSVTQGSSTRSRRPGKRCLGGRRSADSRVRRRPRQASCRSAGTAEARVDASLISSGLPVGLTRVVVPLSSHAPSSSRSGSRAAQPWTARPRVHKRRAHGPSANPERWPLGRLGPLDLSKQTPGR